MDAFNPTPPPWTKTAIHSLEFYCPRCKANASVAVAVWINRRSPVNTYDGRRQWQEFYQCHCDQSWWAWSSDRTPSDGRNE